MRCINKLNSKFEKQQQQPHSTYTTDLLNKIQCCFFLFKIIINRCDHCFANHIKQTKWNFYVRTCVRTYMTLCVYSYVFSVKIMCKWWTLKSRVVNRMTVKNRMYALSCPSTSTVINNCYEQILQGMPFRNYCYNHISFCAHKIVNQMFSHHVQICIKPKYSLFYAFGQFQAETS